jgi:C-terminal of NADH-ubiquinone oxidoreductase 21 kDa subunit
MPRILVSSWLADRYTRHYVAVCMLTLHIAVRFYGATENAREVEMDMQEMVAKVKAGEPLYGESKLTPHMQGVAARQSRYSALFMATVPWFNFVNHGQHGVDTAKYYQQAERELEAERRATKSSSP